MGLDMYLSRRFPIGDQYDFSKVEGLEYKDLSVSGYKIDIKNIDSIEEEFMYWRKANYIHRWFVENVQDGVDDCGTYEVVQEDLLKFYDLCVETRLSHASNLLPPQEGFFFGGTEVDEYYWDTLTETIRVLKPTAEAIRSYLKKRENGDKDYTDQEYQALMSDFFYHASW
jgi:hypothetical protein